MEILYSLFPLLWIMDLILFKDLTALNICNHLIPSPLTYGALRTQTIYLIFGERWKTKGCLGS